jgi:hypothetical protein
MLKDINVSTIGTSEIPDPTTHLFETSPARYRAYQTVAELMTKEGRFDFEWVRKGLKEFIKDYD